jgi:hypothetical protein
MMDVFEAPAEHSLMYEMSETDCVLVNAGQEFELYALLSAAADVQEIVQSCTRLIRSIQRDEQWLFMTHAMHW